ncbi:EAL and GGDEF domain-containing protein [Phaeospirillum tilakii]|uniref:EAL domain-containing protein n=1 Tax=Phaeospirillum tilakii TaxID=741673 RepID=A0ABW5CCN8_9PROT
MPLGPLLQALADAGEIGMILLDADRRVLLWNAWIARAAGIAAEEALNRRLDAVFPGLGAGRIAPAIDQALDDGLSALLTSTLNKRLFPLQRRGDDPSRPVAMQQIVVIRPIDEGGRRHALIQVFDITAMAMREAVLRRQTRTMEALAENYRLSELHNRAIVDNTADAIITFGEDGAIGTYNPSAERIFGYRPAEITGRAVTLLIPDLAGPDGAVATAPFLGQRTEVVAVLKGGARRCLELSLSSMRLGGRDLFIALGHDITARKAGEEALRQQQEWLTTLINALPDLICFKDGAGRWLVANQVCLDLLGLDGRDYVGRTAFELARDAPLPSGPLLNSHETDEMAWRLGRQLSYEVTLTSPGGPRIFDMAKVPLFTPDGGRRGLVVVGRDVTERKLSAARIQHLAHHDSLTELPNRVLFQERLRQALAQARRGGSRLALLFLDLDKFKDINDTLGHAIGDQLLTAVARRLTRCLRETDTVARLGGDEFAVILTNLKDAEGARHVAEAIIASLSEPFRLEDHEVLTSTSIGITLYPDDSETADQLLKNADLAMFQSKADGRNAYHFYVAAMDAEVQARKAIERDMRLALGTPQLELHYQPLLDLKSGRIVGCEALLRWNHPQLGWVPPAQFIPVIERTDLIIPLGRWILHQACRQGRAWRDAGLGPMTIAVNLSPVQFRHSQGLVAMVTDILDQTGLAPEALQLEITEGIAMQNVDSSIEVLKALRALGVTISIDDFGTGYSSLNYLKRFPVDKLKIDRSFVIDIGQHPDNEAVVKAIVDLGHSLRTRVNVEGVESRTQLDFLLAHGVDEAQGYYFSRPVPADAFAALARDPRDWLAADPEDGG